MWSNHHRARPSGGRGTSYGPDTLFSKFHYIGVKLFVHSLGTLLRGLVHTQIYVYIHLRAYHPCGSRHKNTVYAICLT